MMKPLALILTVCAFSLTTTPLRAADVKTYQVTGPVQEVTPSYIVVKKGDANWQIALDKSKKNPGIKVGDKVTVQYIMTATEIEVKPAKAPKPEKK